MTAVVGPAPFLTLGGLSDDELATLKRLEVKLDSHREGNVEKFAYYEAEQIVQHMGIAVPAEISSKIKPAIGWAGTLVDVLEERLDWLGWSEFEDDLGLADIFADNSLAIEAGQGHIDALVAGTSFVRVGSGAEDEPPVLVTCHSPFDTTGTFDPRTRRLMDAVTFTPAGGQSVRVTLDLMGQTVTAVRSGEGRPWVVEDRDEHGMDRLPVVQMTNRRRASRRMGRTEITNAARYYCDAAIRTLLGMETNREFYSIPQMTMVGRGADAFTDVNGNVVSGWRILAGHAIAVDRDEDGEVPEIGQLSVSSPAPFLEQMRGFAQMVAAEAGLPAAYLGFITDNPASADAIRAGEARLVKRAERRQTGFGQAWMEVGRLALMVRDGAAPDDFSRRVGIDWRDASTPTQAAAADWTSKLVASGSLPAQSKVTLRRIGLSPMEIRMLEDERRRGSGMSTLAAALAQPQVTDGAVGG